MHIAFTVESGFSHGNLHIARQFRYFAQQFEMSNDNLTMAEPNTKKKLFWPDIQDSKAVFDYENGPEFATCETFYT